MAARGSGSRANLAWTGAVLLAALLLLFLIVRNAAVMDRVARPGLAEALWPSHPAVATDRALLGIARAAGQGRPAPGSARSDLQRVASAAPLAPDPFLVDGAIAQTEGRDEAAERLFTEARARDPRSRATRYLLAERYLNTGRILDGLIELHVLWRLQSEGLKGFSPAVAAYAMTPGAVPQLKKFFKLRPRVEPTTLSILANDPSNADLILSLATNTRNPRPDWRKGLLTKMVARGDYEKAYEAWARLSGASQRDLLFNPAFAPSNAPPPFNWNYPKASEGVAEPDGKGALEVLFYGRKNSVLASQLLRLPGGTYKLTMNVEAGQGEVAGLRWVVRCLPSGRPIAAVPLRAGAISGQFRVPPECTAQWLELLGVAGEAPQTTEMRISGLRLERGGSS